MPAHETSQERTGGARFGISRIIIRKIDIQGSPQPRETFEHCSEADPRFPKRVGGSMLTHRVANGRAAPRHRNSGFGVRVSPRGWGGSLLCGSWGSQRFVRVGIQTHSVHSGDTSSSLTMKLASPLLCLLLIVLAAFAFSGTEAKLREGECEGGLTLIYRVVDFLWRLSTETSSRWGTRSHSVHAPNVWWKWLFYVCRPRSLPESHRTGSAETH